MCHEPAVHFTRDLLIVAMFGSSCKGRRKSKFRPVLGCARLLLSGFRNTVNCLLGRDCLPDRADCPLRVDFKEPLTEEQREWLLRTPLTLRRISFCREDAASSTLLHRCVSGVYQAVAATIG